MQCKPILVTLLVGTSALAGSSRAQVSSPPPGSTVSPIGVPVGRPGIARPTPCLPFGAAVDGVPLAADPDYRRVLRDWSAISSFTVETWHKFSFVRFGPGIGDYDFSVADQTIQDMVSLGYGAQGMAFHTLFWHNRFQLDPWVDQLGFQGARRVIGEHIDAVHQHYYVGPQAFPINRVDVINEALSDSRKMRGPGPQPGDNPWAQAGTAALGYVDWAEHAVSRAQATFPAGTKLFYNDYGIGLGAIEVNPASAFDPAGTTHISKADAAFKLVRDHLAPAGLDGVGIQTHLIVPYVTNVAALRNTIRRYGEIGIEVHITELDVAIDTGGAAPTPAQLQLQADLYEDVLRICAEEPNCTQITVWGVTDAHTWIPAFAPHCPGCRAPLPHDELGVPKPAQLVIDSIFNSIRAACPR